ncbi:hypothetical protein HAX54_034863, partial [Datura stramonium]|nr:hypothetical protein [Datura stramonium]
DEIKMSLKEELRELHAHMDQIPSAPALLKGSDSQRYMEQPYKSSATLKAIPERFRMSNILEYDGTRNPSKQIPLASRRVHVNIKEAPDIWKGQSPIGEVGKIKGTKVCKRRSQGPRPHLFHG